MKLVIAFIKPRRLEDVTLALREIPGFTGVSVCQVQGFGRGRLADTPEHDREAVSDYLPRSRLEAFCANGIVDTVVSAIVKAAHTGLRGDGKIYVLDVEDAVRISTGERGDTAI